MNFLTLTVFSAEAQTIVDLAVILGMLLLVAVLDYGVFRLSTGWTTG